jgi:hypothetical protein
MSQYLLIEGIIARSSAKYWNNAKLEWFIERIFKKPGETCLCSHYPISEVCILRNKLNGEKVQVGNCCVEKFVELSSTKLFDALERIKQDLNRVVNPEVLDLAHKDSLINDKEYYFYLDTWRRRKLTTRQRGYRIVINKKILKMLQ